MKKLILLGGMAIALTGCQDIRSGMSHMQSSLIGLNRTITLYGATGQVIRTWDIKGKIEDAGGTCRFLTDSGKAITVSGTFVIEEK